MVNSKATLLLHSCCAPCLTSVYEQLAPKYEVTVFWYNPNIYPEAEHGKRLEELARYCKLIGARLLAGDYDYKSEHKYWQKLIQGLEHEPEKGKRCDVCYRMRLEATALTAQTLNADHHRIPFDYFATELSVSPHKKTGVLNQLGRKIEEKVGIKYLTADFKKNNGFLRSTQLSKQHSLYRQTYCGCEFTYTGDFSQTEMNRG